VIYVCSVTTVLEAMKLTKTLGQHSENFLLKLNRAGGVILASEHEDRADNFVELGKEIEVPPSALVGTDAITPEINQGFGCEDAGAQRPRRRITLVVVGPAEALEFQHVFEVLVSEECSGGRFDFGTTQSAIDGVTSFAGIAPALSARQDNCSRVLGELGHIRLGDKATEGMAQDNGLFNIESLAEALDISTPLKEVKRLYGPTLAAAIPSVIEVDDLGHIGEAVVEAPHPVVVEARAPMKNEERGLFHYGSIDELQLLPYDLEVNADTVDEDSHYFSVSRIAATA
jgi:hypothetical protein